MLYGLELSFNPFSTCPSYREVADLPLEQKLARLRDPSLRARLLREEPVYSNPQILAFMRSVANMYVLGDPPNYTPPGDQRLDARAARLGVTPFELAYDLLVSGDGRTILFHPGANYTDASDANMASMLRHDHTVMALGDGGAHYGLICDASYTTHALTYWTRDRHGERWSLPWAVQQLTDAPARLIGLGDRGRLAIGYKADLNVIDLDNLKVAAPHPVHNLPGGGRRLEQKAEGYRAAKIVGGEITYRDGEFTGTLPGRLVRGRTRAGVRSISREEAIMSKPFQVSLAPEKLWQAINAWSFYQQGAQFGLVNIELGQTPRPDIEQAILEKVGGSAASSAASAMPSRCCSTTSS